MYCGSCLLFLFDMGLMFCSCWLCGPCLSVCWLWVLFTISPIKITLFFYCTCGQWDTFTSGPIKKNLLSLWAFCLLDRCDVRHHITSIYYSKITSIYYSKLSDTPQKKKVNSQIQLILQAHLGHHHNYLGVLIAHLNKKRKW